MGAGACPRPFCFRGSLWEPRHGSPPPKPRMPPQRADLSAYKIPESVLVVIHTAGARRAAASAIERADKPWLLAERHRLCWGLYARRARWPHSPRRARCPRRPASQVASNAPTRTGALLEDDWARCWPTSTRSTLRVWRHRYAPGVTHNTEHVFGLRARRHAGALSPREHTATPVAALARGGRPLLLAQQCRGHPAIACSALANRATASWRDEAPAIHAAAAPHRHTAACAWPPTTSTRACAAWGRASGWRSTTWAWPSRPGRRPGVPAGGAAVPHPRGTALRPHILRLARQGQAEFLAPEGYEVAYRSNAVTRHGEHGNALLSRWPLGDVGHHDVSDHRFEQRGLLHVPVLVAGRRSMPWSCTSAWCIQPRAPGAAPGRLHRVPKCRPTTCWWWRVTSTTGASDWTTDARAGPAARRRARLRAGRPPPFLRWRRCSRWTASTCAA
jgi:hypothetical protein